MMIILIGDYFITSQVFNLVFQGEVRNYYSSDCSIYKNAKKTKTKRTWPIFSYLDLTLGY